MLYSDCIEELTGWKDLIIKDVKNVYRGTTYLWKDETKDTQLSQVRRKNF